MAPICPTAFWNKATFWSQTLPITSYVSLLAGGGVSPSPLQGWLLSLLLGQCSHSSSTETSRPCSRAPFLRGHLSQIPPGHLLHTSGLSKIRLGNEDASKSLDASPGSVSNHLFSWTRDASPTGLDFPIYHCGRTLLTKRGSPSQNYGQGLWF